MKELLILMAMQEEANPLINLLQLEDKGLLVENYPMRLFSGQNDSFKISLVLNGADPTFAVDRVGTQASAISTFASLQHINPFLIMSVGTAGGFVKRGATIGDVYCAKEIIYLDRRIPLGQFEAYGVGKYNGVIPEVCLEQDIKSGVLATGNSLGLTAEDQIIIDKYNVVMNDMEAASIAEVCTIKDIPLLAVKVISNLLDQPTVDDCTDFEVNFDKTVNILAHTITKLLHLI